VIEAGPSTHETPGPAGSGLDEDRPEAGEPRPSRAWPWFVSFIVALALVIGMIWVAGGFEYRDDLKTDVAPGESFQTGPYVFTFISATVQKTKNYKDEQIWSLVINGTGQTTGDESIGPDYQKMFVAKDVRTGAYQEEAEQQDFGAEDSRGASGGSFFTPGLPAIPYRVTFEFGVEDFEPGSSILLAVWKLEWRDTSLLQYGDFRWAPTSEYFRLELPMRRLADDLE
jgi:hypothetical protein